MSASSSDDIRRLTKIADMGRTRFSVSQGFIHLTFAVIFFLLLYPLVFTLFVSLKNQSQFDYHRWGLTFPLRYQNFGIAYSMIWRYLLNTVFVDVTATTATVLICSLSAYIFARHRFPGKELLFYMIISLLMIPGVLQLIPAFVLVKDLGLLNTYWVLILPWTSGGQAFGIFLLRSFFAGIPEELFEAARIDGGNELQILRTIGVPLCLPIMATLAVINLIGHWNDYIWPLVTINNPDKQIIGVGIWRLTQTMMETAPTPVFAAYIITAVPVIVLFALANRVYVEGLLSGALKI